MTTPLHNQDIPDLSFDPACAMAQAYELEKRCHEWGVTRRITTCLATKSRDDLTAALLSLSTSAEGDEVIDLFDSLQGLIEHHELLLELFRSVQARLYIAAHDAFGIPIGDIYAG